MYLTKNIVTMFAKTISAHASVSSKTNSDKFIRHYIDKQIQINNKCENLNPKSSMINHKAKNIPNVAKQPNGDFLFSLHINFNKIVQTKQEFHRDDNFFKLFSPEVFVREKESEIMIKIIIIIIIIVAFRES